METIREIRGEESSGSGPLQTQARVRGELIQTRDLLSGDKRREELGNSRGTDQVKAAIDEVP